MTHITVPDELPRAQFQVGGTPTAGPFPFSFAIFDEATDVVVSNGDTALVAGVDFTVTGNPGAEGGFDGGNVTLAAPVSNTVITIERELALERVTDFPSAGTFPIQSLNTDLDRLVAMVQQLNLKLRRTALLHIAATLLDLEFPLPAAGQAIGWNPTADGLINLPVAGLAPPVSVALGGTGGTTAEVALRNLIMALTEVVPDLAADFVPFLSAGNNVARKVKAENLIAPFSWLLPYRTGHYYHGQGDSDTTGTLSVVANRLYAFPITIVRNHNFQGITIHVTTGVVGTARLGIYADNGAGYPGGRVQDVGTVDTTASGWKDLLAPIPLKPGQYWLSMVSSAAPTVRRLGRTATIMPLGEQDADLTGSGVVYLGVQVAQPFGALPPNFPAGATYLSSFYTGDVPRIMLLG
jgi:hypothetical protein